MLVEDASRPVRIYFLALGVNVVSPAMVSDFVIGDVLSDMPVNVYAIMGGRIMPGPGAVFFKT
jgi:hypothetical protein